MSSKILPFKILASLVAIFLLIFCYKTISNFSKCAMQEGPLYGKEILINIENTMVDTLIKIPNGQLGFINTRMGEDTLNSKPPILIKLDNANKVLWAYQFENEDKDEENIAITCIRLQEEDGKKVIKFFNETYQEPGKIYLTNNYDFDYLCLSII